MEKGQEVLLASNCGVYKDEADWLEHCTADEYEPGSVIYLVEVKKVGVVMGHIEWEE